MSGAPRPVTAARGAYADDVAADLARLLLRGVPVNFAVGISAAAACAWMLRGVEPARLLISWLALYLGLYLLRVLAWLGSRAGGAIERDPRRWLSLARLSVLAVGLAWGLLPALLFPSAPLQALFVALVASAVCGAGMAAYAPDAAAALLFVLPIVLPTSLHLFASGQELLQGCGVLGMLYTAFLLHAARRTNVQFQHMARHRAQVTEQLSRDHLTGLGSRVDLDARLRQALARAERRGTQVAVGYIDLDNFKPVNDRHGHAAGDALLRELAARWRDELRSSELIARLGGDEFVIVIEDLDPREAQQQLGAVFERLHRAVDMPFQLGGQSVRVGMTVGVACYPIDGSEADILLRHADAAMYHGKQYKGQHRAWWPARAEAGVPPLPRAVATS